MTNPRFRFDPINVQSGRPYNRTLLMAGLFNAVRDTTSDGERFIRQYPPQVLTSTGYRRTGTLGRSWTGPTTVRGTRIVGVVGSNSNIAPYNRDVQGEKQLRIFRGANWPNVQQLATKMQRELVRNVEGVLAGVNL